MPVLQFKSIWFEAFILISDLIEHKFLCAVKALIICAVQRFLSVIYVIFNLS